jgi:tetratricopeptide (TPR) repeat protein
MKRGLGFLTGTARRRRLVFWTVVGLTLAGLGLGILEFFVWPAALLRDAEEALRRNDPAAARAPLDRYLARRPHDPRALLLAAQAARRSDACADAERFLTAFEQVSGPTDASRVEWALLGVQQGDFGGDESDLRSAVVRNHPDAPVLLEALAKGYYVTFRLPDALEAVNRLLELNPDHVPALILRGTILDRQRQTDAAAADFRRAVDRAPDSAAAHAALAGLLNRLGHTREAICHYHMAQRLRPADAVTRLGLARALTDAAELAEAQRCLDELLAAEPVHPDGLVERGRLALRQERFAEAEPLLARAVRTVPWHRDGQQLYLLALKKLGRSQAAAQGEARLAELKAQDAIAGPLKLRARDNPRDLDVRWELWLWSVRNGDSEEGLAWLAGVLRINPRYGPAHAALADHFDRAGQPRRAALHRAAAAGR